MHSDVANQRNLVDPPPAVLKIPIDLINEYDPSMINNEEEEEEEGGKQVARKMLVPHMPTYSAGIAKLSHGILILW